MTYKDPSQQLLKAYCDILAGNITYGSETIKVGTRIPRRTDKYVYLYIDSSNNYSTGDKVLYNITMAMQIVTLHDISEGDETIANSILDQVLQLVGNPDSIVMTDFICLTAQFGDSEHDSEMAEANYIITKKLRMNHFVEQK